MLRETRDTIDRAGAGDAPLRVRAGGAPSAVEMLAEEVKSAETGSESSARWAKFWESVCDIGMYDGEFPLEIYSTTSLRRSTRCLCASDSRTPTSRSPYSHERFTRCPAKLGVKRTRSVECTSATEV